MHIIKLKKFFLLVLLSTIILFLYAHQNIEIIRLGYSITENQRELSYFLDENRVLLYTSAKLESPSTLSNRLENEEIELVEADIGNVYYADIDKPAGDDTKQDSSGTLINALLDIITLKAEAHQNN